ncbi:MAG: DUF3592 domain-containing protein [Mojavia pulchra JT2-VF2]|jgi:hypothetical protein|uniref:DUF3592 domain-containing protein n=1 Tax=Mojavia pulchra JT2-VF2 TaxID=287848 RepID=A0A951PW21_9NOST|nr:DUF3592 domain-containing protein [Mojavia pulchra JT2-VF2]
MNEDSKFMRLFGSVFGGIGSIFAVTGIMIGLNTHSFVATAIPAQGTIINLVQRSSTDSKGRSSSVYYPVVKFSTQSGETKVFESDTGSNPPGFTKGQQVEVLYSPQKPDSAKINSWSYLWLLPVIFTGLGSTFMLIGGVVIFKSFPRFKSVR